MTTKGQRWCQDHSVDGSWGKKTFRPSSQSAYHGLPSYISMHIPFLTATTFTSFDPIPILHKTSSKAQDVIGFDSVISKMGADVSQGPELERTVEAP